MEKIKQIFNATVAYAKANPVQLAIVVGLVLLAIVLIIAIAVRSTKAKKARKQESTSKNAVAASSATVTTTEKNTAEKNVEESVAPVTRAPVDNAKKAKTETAAKAMQGKNATDKKAPKADVTAEKAVTKKAERNESDKKNEEKKTKTPVESVNKKTTKAKKSVEVNADVEAEAQDEAAYEPSTTEKEYVVTPLPKAKPTKAKGAKKAARNENDVDEALEMFEDYNEDEDSFLRDHYDEGEMDRIAKYRGKWVICRLVTNDKESEEMYFFELHASNGEKLLSSEEYTSYAGALRGIETHKANILNGNLKITLSKKGDYIFKLLSGKNMLLCMGENYPTKARCESAMESTVRFAETAVIDENVQDIFIKVPVEDDTPIQPLPDGCTGKWIISSTETADGDRIYYFELFANNGEKLLASEEYMTYIGAVNGIQTHKKNIATGNFRISLTKRGDYIYKLLNGNGQLLCLGEHYRTKRLCKNAVESVKRFAMSSPVLTSDELLNH